MVDFSRTRERCTWRASPRPGNSRGDLPRRREDAREDEGQRPMAAHLSSKMSVQEEERQGRSARGERERERGAYPTGNEARAAATRRKCRGKRLRRALGSIRDAAKYATPVATRPARTFSNDVPTASANKMAERRGQVGKMEYRGLAGTDL
ncbi:uncharacterized protein LOC143362712 isoform X1 [Halictus rubicundus]|uniref:uncharacterized protein LOC143362712 isoform X1 n=1 Tax=Halictus rubicundus TaxID=77578 RepID=UPI0040356758